jgi:hypothetical protein
VAPLVDRQLLRAGIRLAMLLNDAFGAGEGREESIAETTPARAPPESASPSSVPATRTVCRIKGNVTAGHRKLYHRPDCPSYDRVEIDPAKGERCFDTEAEAVAAGWRPAGNCP